ncbi:MAG: hypothetical protein ACRCWR_10790, partial [Saezia sp.]
RTSSSQPPKAQSAAPQQAPNVSPSFKTQVKPAAGFGVRGYAQKPPSITYVNDESSVKNKDADDQDAQKKNDESSGEEKV